MNFRYQTILQPYRLLIPAYLQSTDPTTHIPDSLYFPPHQTVSDRIIPYHTVSFFQGSDHKLPANFK